MFGQDHPPNGALLLIRYTKHDGIWVKPPTYAPETLDGTLIACYDIPTVPVYQYGITLGLGYREKSAVKRYYDPLAVEGPTVGYLRGIARCPVGLIGSRLLGINRATSDLDLVLYGDNAIDGGRRILRACKADMAHIARTSVSLQRFISLAGDVPRYSERNIFKGRFEAGNIQIKLDLHYSRSNAHISFGSHKYYAAVEPVALHKLTVVDDRHRPYFPGYLQCEDSRGELYRVWIKDHALGYVLRGDRISIHGHRIVDSPYPQVVGERVTALSLR